MTRPATLAEVADRRTNGEEFGSLVAEFLDTFYGTLKREGDAAAHIADQPATIADSVEHALLGAVGEHLARRWSLPIPSWTSDPTRFLSRPHFTNATGQTGFECHRSHVSA